MCVPKPSPRDLKKWIFKQGYQVTSKRLSTLKVPLTDVQTSAGCAMRCLYMYYTVGQLKVRDANSPLLKIPGHTYCMVP